MPPLVCGIITGASIGHAGIGNFGAGAAIGAAGIAAGAAGVAGGMIAGGAMSIAGGTSALMAACKSGQQNMSSPGSLDMSGGGPGGSGGSTSSGLSPLAMACGDKHRSGASITRGRFRQPV